MSESRPPEDAAMAGLRAVQSAIQRFLLLESAGGILLVGAAVLATLLMNSPLAGGYAAFLQLPVTMQFGDLGVSKPLLLWINDGLMAIFFFLVGLELKRELLEGELSTRSQVLLPAAAAIGGMAVPAIVYVLFNAGDPVAIKGWAIPAATDIAFAVGVLTVLGTRVPASLKIFLLALAIIDDLGAIIIIALFYTGGLSTLALLVAAVAMVVLLAFNLGGVMRPTAYYIVGVALWLAVLKSGVHATLAGVLCAAFVPLKGRRGSEPSPLRTLEESLHPWVVYAILPVFALTNAGIDFSGVSLEDLTGRVPLGIAAGLFIGKQAGVFLTVLLLVKTGLASKPEGARWSHIYGVAVLCGIGFTMSLFIGSLAVETHGERYQTSVRVGVIAGSLLSALVGYLFLRFVAPPAVCEAVPPGRRRDMLLLIDNYDSFTYNLAQYLGELGADVHVHRNDAITLEQIAAWQPERIVISPGPCTPSEAGISVPVIQRFAGMIPILGVCLGHQAIGQAFGGRIVRGAARHARQAVRGDARRTRRVRRAAIAVPGDALPLAGDRAREPARSACG